MVQVDGHHLAEQTVEQHDVADVKGQNGKIGPQQDDQGDDRQADDDHETDDGLGVEPHDHQGDVQDNFQQDKVDNGRNFSHGPLAAHALVKIGLESSNEPVQNNQADHQQEHAHGQVLTVQSQELLETLVFGDHGFLLHCDQPFIKPKLSDSPFSKKVDW